MHATQEAAMSTTTGRITIDEFHAIVHDEERSAAGRRTMPWDRMTDPELLATLPQILASAEQNAAFAQEWVDMLRERSLQLFASGLTDPDLSLAASIHLFAAAGLTRPAALNGPQFLEDRGVTDNRLRAAGDLIKVPSAPGLGVEVQGAAWRTVAGVRRENGRRYG